MNIDAIDKECLISSNNQTSVIFGNELVELNYSDELETNLENGEEGGALVDLLTPTEGMLFSTPEEAFEFYNRYALKMGFKIRKSSTSLSKIEKTKIIGRKFVCNREGKRKRDSEKTTHIHNCHSGEIRVGCNAMMWIRLTESGSWNISKFVSQHNNHDLSTPSEASEHVHDNLRVKRKNNLGKNCVKVVNHFMNKNDPGFFFNIEVADDCALRSIFWADRRSQESYKKFSDVIIFDVTYRRDNFNLPFAPFTGINHHYQSSLFGCALLADETEETFVWLFEQWLKCMDGKEPTVIITDQDVAIGNAIARVFPNTLHRYCDWFLDRNITENLKHLKATHGPNIELDFDKLRSSDSVHEAEECWSEMMTKYNLREKSWLPKLWKQRKSWVPCYLEDTFVAATQSSQRTESINTFFDTYVTYSTPLHEFVEQYDKALASRRNEEEDADFNTTNSKPVLVLGWPLEEEAAKCYTLTLFDILHTQMKDSVHYWAEKVHKNGTLTTFKVGRPQIDRSKWKLVTYDSNGVFVSCQCKHFEKNGLLCRHALCILWKKQISNIPDRYILRRWTIESRYQPVQIGFGTDVVASEVDRDLLWCISYKINKILEEAYKSQTFAEKIDRDVTRLLAETVNGELRVHDSQVDPTLSQHSQHSSNTIPEIINQDPTGVARTKERPIQTSRIQSSLEISQEDKTKKRTCGFCKEKGHYRTGCSKAKEMERKLRD